MTKSEAAFLFAAEELSKNGRVYMWTFTFAELLDILDTRKRWNHLLTLLLRMWPGLQGLRVFEMHKEHGLHVHVVTNLFIDVNVVRPLAEQAGWGRVHVEQIPVAHASYLAKYLSKERPPCLRRWRLWAAFGEGWEPTKVKDVGRLSDFSTVYRACKELYGWQGRGEFQRRMSVTRQMLNLTIEKGWKPGLGPFEKPYWMCTTEELAGESDAEAPF